MSIRAYVHPYQFGGSLAVSLVQHYEGEAAHMRPQVKRFEGDGIATWAEVDEYGGTDRPTFIFDYEEAAALMHELHKILGGVESPQALRRDYDAERRRADKLTDALIDIARAGRAQ